MTLSLVAWMGCAGQTEADDKGPSVDGDVDTDTDTDTDTDADTDVHSAHTAVVHSATAGGVGPIAPAWYRMFSAFYYRLPVPGPPGSGGGGGDSGSGTGDTGTGGPAVFWPQYVSFATNFGFDPNGNMVAVDAGTFGMFEPTLYATLVTDRFVYELSSDPIFTEEYCTIAVPLTGAYAPAVLPAGRLWWGYEWTGATVEGNCNTPGWPLDPRYFGDPAVDWVTIGGMGFAVGAPTAEIQNLLLGVIDPLELVGGSFTFEPLGIISPDDRVFGQAFVVDPTTMELQLTGAEGDEITPIPRASLFPWP